MELVLGICTLQYEKKCVDALIPLMSANIFSGWVIPDSCLLPQARNRVVKIAYENNPEFTHILFIDDDMCGFGVAHVQRLLQSMDNLPECSVLSALVTQRKPPYQIVAHFNQDTKDDMSQVLGWIQKGIVKRTNVVGMAFTLIKREAFDTIREETIDGPIWFTTDRENRITFEQEKVDFIEAQIKSELSLKSKLAEAVSFGQMSHIGGQIIGEDIAFSKRVTRAGLKLFVDCGCSVGHIGPVGFDFRHAFLEQQEELLSPPRNSAVIEV